MICIVEIGSFASLLTQFGANVCTYNFQLHFFFVSLSLSAVVRAVIVCRKQISGWKWGNDKETFFSLVVICDAFYGWPRMTHDISLSCNNLLISHALDWDDAAALSTAKITIFLHPKVRQWEAQRGKISCRSLRECSTIMRPVVTWWAFDCYLSRTLQLPPLANYAFCFV